MSNAVSTVPESATNERASGIVLLVTPLAMVAGMAVHPSVHSHSDSKAVLDQIASFATLNTAVHGALIGVLSIVLVGFIGFSKALGLRSVFVRAGLVAYGLGTVALIGAASINGIVLSAIAVNYHDSKPEVIESIWPIVRLCTQSNLACDYLGVFFLSAAVACWSVVLLGRGGSLWSIGAAGLVVGFGAPIMLVTGNLPMSVHGFGAFVMVQAIWYVAVGWQMVKGRV